MQASFLFYSLLILSSQPMLQASFLSILLFVDRFCPLNQCCNPAFYSTLCWFCPLNQCCSRQWCLCSDIVLPSRVSFCNSWILWYGDQFDFNAPLLFILASRSSSIAIKGSMHKPPFICHEIDLNINCSNTQTMI